MDIRKASREAAEAGKKIADDVYNILSRTIDSDDAEIPDEYLVMKLCERFHCLPDAIRQMPEADLQTLLLLMSAEAEAGRLKQNQAGFYGK